MSKQRTSVLEDALLLFTKQIEALLQALLLLDSSSHHRHSDSTSPLGSLHIPWLSPLQLHHLPTRKKRTNSKALAKGHLRTLHRRTHAHGRPFLLNVLRQAIQEEVLADGREAVTERRMAS